jgi:hypothetical protein
VLCERSLWTRLDLSRASGVHVHLAPNGNLDALLRCAAARAGGDLQSLQVDMNRVTHAALLEVAAVNGNALRELHVHNIVGLGLHPAEVEALLRAAPLLLTFGTALECDNTEVQAARRLLRNEALFPRMRVRRLYANLHDENEAGVVALAADVAAHASLCELSLEAARLETHVALDAVVDAALARRMQTVALKDSHLSPASAPALARLLGGGALTALHCRNMNVLDTPAAAALAAALRANSTLTSLTLLNAGAVNDPAAAAELLGALSGHASLRALRLMNNRVFAAHQAAVGASLGALVAANAPTLRELHVSWCDLRDDGLRALFEALPRNSHLRVLCVAGHDMSEAFARDVMLPAVRANTSLRKLDARHFAPGNYDGHDAAREAADLVRRRA